jgi:hypothetical protein
MKLARFKLMVLMLLLCHVVDTSAVTRGFAIFIDSISFSHVKKEVALYAASIEQQGLATETIVVSDTLSPDAIRQMIRQLATRKSRPIEGMVFIGDIAIPMVLDAQHMASAFKIQRTASLEQSSCPSDRFYDDLNLSFNFVSQDPKKPHLYYYSLSAESPQVTMPTLYSGRIKCDNIYGRSKYENLAAYLTKVVRVKARKETLNQMLLFSGSGYNSESIMSRIDEKSGLLEQFPFMKGQPQSLTFLDHRHSVFTKYTLMSEMQKPDLSLALLHHHGAPDKEYINRFPDTRNARDQLEGAKYYFRSKIRSSLDRGLSLDSAITYYEKNYDVPRHWFDNVMDSTSIAADSVYADQMDLHLHDFDTYKPNARVVMLDACFNGAFNNDRYIAEAYIFGEGDCVVAIANSVNSLQDKWCDKYIGLLALGMRVGNLVKYNPYLESHVLGDPTFSFAPHPGIITEDFNESLYRSSKYWRKQLYANYPALRAMALEQLYLIGEISHTELLSQFTSSDSFLVRFSALMLLARDGDSPEFEKVIELGLSDSYELIRRFAAIYAGENGSPSLIPALIRAYTTPTIGERVTFQIRNSMPMFSYDALIAELEKQQPYRYAYNASSLMEEARSAIEKRFSDKKYTEELNELKAENPNKRTVRLFIRQLRNNTLHGAIEQVFDYINAANTEPKEQVAAIEALGWFNYSYRSTEIIRRLKEISSDNHFAQEVRQEAIKSIRRLNNGKKE